MISPEIAKTIIEQNKFSTKMVSMALDSAYGFQLAEDLFADRDFPPFHRVMMDGLAVQDLKRKQWPIEQTVYAGQAKVQLQNPDAGIEIMTGAPLPDGCKAIVPVEELEIKIENGHKVAYFKGKDIADGQFIHRQGSDIQKDQLLIPKNTKMGAIQIALAASIGKATLQVFEKPKIGLIATGDELVGVDQIPLPHQIRSSNMPMIQSVLIGKKYVSDLFHLRDDREEMRQKLTAILAEKDILLLSGGVSAGKKDFIPDVLEEIGFTCHFHKIAQKPGKPMWFGTRSQDQKTIFALPGNPISTLVCFYNYFLPTIEHQAAERGFTKVLNPKPAHTSLDLWLPAKWKNPFQEAEILPNNGSGDMVAWREADVILWQKAGDNSVYLPYVPL